MRRMATIGIIVCFMLIGLLTGCGGSGGGGGGGGDVDGGGGGGTTTIDPQNIEPSSIETFLLRSGDICREDGKPVIRMFSTSWCSHCQWVAETFETVAQMYVEEGLVVAHHWELDTGDDLLTSQVEESVPDSEMGIFISFNPQESIPTFVFGCKYYRIGTGHEAEDDLEAEAAEFMAVIEALLDE